MWKLSMERITSRQQEENVEVMGGGGLEGERRRNFSLKISLKKKNTFLTLEETDH